MVTILPFVADPVLYRNPPNHILPLYNTDKQAYISQCLTVCFTKESNCVCHHQWMCISQENKQSTEGDVRCFLMMELGLEVLLAWHSKSFEFLSRVVALTRHSDLSVIWTLKVKNNRTDKFP